MFGRGKRATGDPIGEFWSWWAANHERYAHAIASGEYGSLSDEMTQMVRRIDPGLEWEFSAGRQAQHQLCVTAAGVPELRARAERWLRAGPGPGGLWEYAGARQPDPNVLHNVLGLGGASLPLSDLWFGAVVDDERGVVDVTAYHPLFGTIDEPARLTAAFLSLDWLLGEDGVARWIGTVDVAVTPPAAAVPAASLPGIVDTVVGMEPTWTLMKGEGPRGRPILVTARRPLKRAEFPLFDLHGTLSIPFAEQTAVGWPDQPALDRLRVLEDHLLTRFPLDQLLLAAHATCNGVRTFLLYCDAESETPAAITSFVESALPLARLKWVLDPGWTATAPFR